MNTKIAVMFLLCMLQVPTILTGANTVIKEYASIIFDIQLRLEHTKLSVGETEAFFRKNASQITENVQLNVSDFTETIKRKIEEDTGAINCNPDKEVECKNKKAEEIQINLNISSNAALKTCIGVFSKAVNAGLSLFPSYYDQIDNTIANITDVNKFCTQQNSTTDTTRLCFFEELAFNRLPYGEKIQQAQLDLILLNVTSTIESSKVMLTKCAGLVNKTIDNKSETIVRNYKYCCNPS